MKIESPGSEFHVEFKFSIKNNGFLFKTLIFNDFLFSHNTCVLWVSLPCSPEHRGRQCRNFTFPAAAVKRHHYSYCCCIPLASDWKSMFFSMFFNDFTSNIKKTQCFLMISHQISRKHNVFNEKRFKNFWKKLKTFVTRATEQLQKNHKKEKMQNRKI